MYIQVITLPNKIRIKIALIEIETVQTGKYIMCLLGLIAYTIFIMCLEQQHDYLEHKLMLETKSIVLIKLHQYVTNSLISGIEEKPTNAVKDGCFMQIFWAK